MEKPVIIFGAKGLGKAALEIFLANEVVVYCFLDDLEELHGTEIGEVSVLGGFEDSIVNDIGKKCEAFVAVDDNSLKKSLVDFLKVDRKVMPINALHPRAILASTASLGHGNLISAGVIVGANATVGGHCILNSAVTVEYDVQIGDFVQLGGNSVLGPGCQVGDEVFVGSGVTVVAGVKLGKGARIGAGSVVIQDVKAGRTVFGNPAQEVKDK